MAVRIRDFGSFDLLTLLASPAYAGKIIGVSYTKETPNYTPLQVQPPDV